MRRLFITTKTNQSATMISGEEFNKLYPNTSKVTINYKRDSSYLYKEGINDLDNSFNRICGPNQLTCCFKKDFGDWFEQNDKSITNTWAVTIPNDAKVNVTENKIQADKFIISHMDTLLGIELSLIVVKLDGFFLEYIPKEYRTYNVCMAAVMQQGDALVYVPEQHKSNDLCLAAMKQNNLALRFVPEKVIDEVINKEMCMEIVEQNGYGIYVIPQKFVTYEMCLTAIRQDPGAICNIPLEHKSYELCLEVVVQNGYQLKFIPHKFYTSEMFMAAVSQCGVALEWVPEEHKSYGLCLAAVIQNGNAMYYVPHKHRSYNLCYICVSQCNSILKCVPEEHKTHDLCLKAVTHDGCALEFVPKELRTVELCLIAVIQDYYAMRYVPDEIKDEVEKLNMYKVCLSLVEKDGKMLERIPHIYQDIKICLAAVKQNSSAISFVSDEFKDEIKDEIKKLTTQHNIVQSQ